MKNNLAIAFLGIALLWCGAHALSWLNHISRLTPAGQWLQALALASCLAGCAVIVWGCCRRRERRASGIHMQPGGPSTGQHPRPGRPD